MPNPGVRLTGFGNTIHTIDANGLRHTGKRPFSDEGPILAVGDSYTYGDEVNDEETWPAQLQRLTGRRVLNGGVTGYGFDQIVLRAEQLAAIHRPAVVIVGFIAHDLLRTEAHRLWWRGKPWFAIEDDRLVLKGVPVPDDRSRLPPRLRHRMADILVSLPPWLQHLTGYHSRVHPRGDGLAIALRLTERLAALRPQSGAPIVVMAQYPPAVWSNPTVAGRQRRMTKAILDAATSHGLAALDTYPRLATEPKPLNFYASTHMNVHGNAMVASLLAATLPALLEGQTVKP